jgi:agmatine/peptidylarginine deiminase
MISYPLYVPMELVVEMALDVEVLTVVQSEAGRTQAQRDYLEGGVDLDNCTFLIAPLEGDPYSRDWGPWFLFDGADLPGVVDFVYEWPNSPGNDAIPTVYAQSEGLPVYDMDIVTAGGNYMTDGQGTAMATDFLWYNNPDKTPGEIDAILDEYLGIQSHHVLPDNFYYFHIDCYAKYLTPRSRSLTSRCSTSDTPRYGTDRRRARDSRSRRRCTPTAASP